MKFNHVANWPLDTFLTAVLRERPPDTRRYQERLPQWTESGYAVLPAVILDLDGTIRYSKSGTFINGPEDIVIYPDVEPRLLEFFPDYLIFGVSNQGGVAYGHKTPEQDYAEIAKTLDLFDTEDLFFAIFSNHNHPKGTVVPYNHSSLMRKPNYGMLVLCEWYALQYHLVIDWDRSFMVGDREEDKLCAQTAGIPFMYAQNFFNRNIPEENESK